MIKGRLNLRETMLAELTRRVGVMKGILELYRDQGALIIELISTALKPAMLPTEGLTKFMTMLGTLLICNKFVANVLSALKSVGLEQFRYCILLVCRTIGSSSVTFK